MSRARFSAPLLFLSRPFTSRNLGILITGAYRAGSASRDPDSVRSHQFNIGNLAPDRYLLKRTRPVTGAGEKLQ